MSNTKDEKTIGIRSVFFVIGFWTVTALLFIGLYRLFDTIDIRAIMSSIFNA